MSSKPNDVLYIGMTSDLTRRLEEHKSGEVEGFTEKYWVHKLVYYEVFKEVHEAIKREKAIKKWRRAWKIRLIEESNPEWSDLSYEYR